MAEPGDLPPPDAPLVDQADVHDDDLIGFATPASLQGRLRHEPEPEPEPEPDPEPEPAPEPEPEPGDEPGDEPLPPEPGPVEAGTLFAPSSESPMRKRRRDPDPAIPGGGLGLFAVYALILLAVPTAGVSGAIALFAVTGRDEPDDHLSASHFIYQRRTLWAAAVVAVAGVILLAAPFALGVPILFALALWILARGASGVWALKSGREITDPLGWWI